MRESGDAGSGGRYGGVRREGIGGGTGEVAAEEPECVSHFFAALGNNRNLKVSLIWTKKILKTQAKFIQDFLFSSRAVRKKKDTWLMMIGLNKTC